MDINLPKGTFKSMPKRAWVFISLGIMTLLILLGMTFYKYGGIYIKTEKKLIEKTEQHLKEIQKDASKK